MERVYYDERPSKFEAVGNGSFRYRWDIKEETIQRQIMADSQNQQSDVSHTQYSCYEVIVWATVTSNKIMEAVIGKMWDVSYEQKLINEYNSAKLGLSDIDPDASIEAYRKFLFDRKCIKDQIDADCKELNIS